jgi:CheY-like chemotaxis protein
MEAWDGAALEGLTLLIITDALDSTKSLIEPLRSAGAVVVAVCAAQLALAYSERHAVDAILVDLRESGWTLTPDTRALRSLTRVPMYTMTEPGDPMLDAAADLAGYFSKPVRVEALIGTLSVLQRRLR